MAKSGSPKSKSKKSPKSKSPKKSPKSKKSPSKKGSPKKQKAEPIPPVDECIQTDPSNLCFFCLREFRDSAAIQAHILLMDHMEPYNATEQLCRACKCKVMLKDVEKHKCAVMKAIFLRFTMSGTTLDYGPPYRCLYCRTLPLCSRVELAMHLICYHRPGKPTGRCGLCTFSYDEPPPPPVPNIPAPPANADVQTKLAYAKELRLATWKAIGDNPPVSTPGLEQLYQHISIEHVPGYTLLHRKNLLTESYLRFPYACPICNWQLQSNYALHAHVVCVHGNASVIENALKVCAMCGFAASSDEGLNQHVLMNHTEELMKRGQFWIKRELMMNVTDPGTVCAYCWQTFRFDFQLQAHLLAAHTTTNALKCGWCKVDFLSCPDPIIAFMVMQHHEFNHARVLHQNALNAKVTYQPLMDLLPEDADRNILITARTGVAPRGDSPSKGKKGKKSPKKSPSKKSGSKKSPKSGSSKKSKKK